MSNVTPIEIAGIVASAFDLSPKDLATRISGRWGEMPRPLVARAVTVRLIRAHTEARLTDIARLLGIDTNSLTRRFGEADLRLSQEMAKDPTLHDLVGKCETEIDDLHEARSEARDKALADIGRRMAGAGADAKWASEAPKQGVRP